MGCGENSTRGHRETLCLCPREMVSLSSCSRQALGSAMFLRPQPSPVSPCCPKLNLSPHIPPLTPHLRSRAVVKGQSRVDVRGTHPAPHREEKDEEGTKAADTVSSPSGWSESCTEKPGGGISRCHLGRQDDRRGGSQGGMSTHDAMDGKAGPSCSHSTPPHAKGRGGGGQEGAGGQGWCCP